MIARIIEAGYLYEIVGLGYYISFLIMQRPKNRDRYSVRSRVLTFLAAFALVASVPFGYAHSTPIVALVFAIAVAAIVSTFLDARGR